MAAQFRIQMRGLMKQAWLLVKTYGFSMAEAMKQAWLIFKLKKAMHKGIVKFMFQKLNGEMRTAWGTLQESLLPQTNGSERRKNETLFTYFDTEKTEYRCFKIANLISIQL